MIACHRRSYFRRFAIFASVASLALAAALDVDAGPRTQATSTRPASQQPNWFPFALGNRTPNPAVARIAAVERNAISQGSGTLVDVRGQRGLVVTNWHVVRDATGPIVATFPDGFRSAATVLKVDKDWDLAALLIWRPNTTPIAISTTAPRVGDALTIAGYGSGNYRAVTGRCTQYVAPGDRMPYEMVELSAEARQGDSGGPILNDRGELAGVLFGAANGTTSGSFCGRVRWFLESVWPNTEVPNIESPNIAPGDPTPDTDVFVATQLHAPNTDWPTDRMVAVSQPASAINDARPASAPNYSVGSTFAAAHRDAEPALDSNSSFDFKAIAGATPFEQTKSILAVIGILALVVQITRVVSR